MKTVFIRFREYVKTILLPSWVGLIIYKLLNITKVQFICPICNYHGPFIDIRPETGLRKNAYCPKCGSLERHRLQYLVVKKIADIYNLSQMSILHCAPEPFFKKYFTKVFKSYYSMDIKMKSVDLHANILKLPFKDNSFDFIFASHVLEEIKDDLTALSEIRRILTNNGIAILPVPIVANRTVEYPEANPHESNSIRAPGPDYFEKYLLFFKRIENYTSSDFCSKFQTFICENRAIFPTANIPYRPPLDGEKHIDIVPVCYTE